MITIVTPADYNGIKESFTEEEIKEKYGKIKVMSEHEYKQEKISEKKKVGDIN